MNVLKAIERVTVPDEANIPVVKFAPSVSVPPDIVNVPVAVNAYAFEKVTAPPERVNVGTALNTAVLLYVNVPAETTKLTLGVIVPLAKAKVAPLTVNVVQLSVPILLNEPPTNVNVLEQVNV